MYSIFRRYKNVLPDGRTSLKQFFKQDNKNDFKNHWLKDPSTYPIIGVMGFAVSMVTCVGTYFLLNEPDVHLNKEDRKNPIPNNYEEGSRWNNHGLNRFLGGKDPSKNNLFDPLKTIFK